MMHHVRYAACLVALAALVFGMPVFAQQDDDEIVVVGSLYLEDLMQAALTSAADELDFSVEAQGNVDGFQRLCDGTADISMATRAISDEQILDCASNDIEFVELVVAVEALVLATSAENELTCLSTSRLPTVFSRTEPPNWSELSPDGAEEPVALYGPGSVGRAYSLATALLNDEIPRIDYEETDRLADSLEFLDDSNSLVFTTLAEWDAVEDKTGIQALEFNTPDAVDCVAPSAETASSGDYPAARSLMLYANAASLDKLSGVLDYILTEDFAEQVAEQGFSVPTAVVSDRNRENTEQVLTGRTFSRSEIPTSLNTAVTGEISITGASLSSYATEVVYDTFGANFSGIAIDYNTFGDDRAWSALCSGDALVIQTGRSATNAELEMCQENEIVPYEINFGADAVVFVANADSELPVCLSYDQVSQLLIHQEAPDDDDDPAQGPTSWSEIDADGPDLPLLVLVPPLGALETDIVQGAVSPGGYIRRTDAPTVVETPEDVNVADIDYRLGGVANTDNAITYVFWSDFDQNAAKDSLRAIEIDAGDGCMAPSGDNIMSGDYPFAFSSRLVFASGAAAQDDLVAALLWHTHTRDALGAVEELDLVGFDRAMIESERETIYTLIETSGPSSDEDAPPADDEDSEPPTDDDDEPPVEQELPFFGG